MRAKFSLTDKVLASLRAANVPDAVLVKLQQLPVKEFETLEEIDRVLTGSLSAVELAEHRTAVLTHATGRSYVAVVTVHGVGDQLPNKTARTVADLLLSRNRAADATQYTPFDETTVRIATRRVSPDTPLATEDLSQSFMNELLDEYKGEDPAAAYETVRLEGARLEDVAPHDNRRIHVYDMFWADLSQLGSGLLRVLAEFFLLIFHLGDLGRRTAQFASKEEGANWLWKGGILNVQKAAVWLLTCPIVVFNLYELAVAMLALPLKLGELGQQVVALAALAIIVAVLIGKGLFAFFPALSRTVWWSLSPVAALAVWGLLFYLIQTGLMTEAFHDSYYRLLGFDWCVATSYLLYQLLRPYSKARTQAGGLPPLTAKKDPISAVPPVAMDPAAWEGGVRRPARGELPGGTGVSPGRTGATPVPPGLFEPAAPLTGIFSAVMGAGTALCFLWLVFSNPNTLQGVYTAALRTFEVLFVLVTLSWLLLFLLILVQGFFLAGVYFHHKDDAEKRAAGTVFISLLHPTALFRVLTLALWGGLWLALVQLSENKDPANKSVNASDTMNAPVIAQPWIFAAQEGERVGDFGERILGFSSTVAFSPALLVIACAFVVVVWGHFPAVWIELHPSPGADKRLSQSLGKWLTHGYTGLFAVAPLIVFLAVPVLLLVGYLVRFDQFTGVLSTFPWLKTVRSRLEGFDLLKYLSFGLSGVFIGLFTFRGSLGGLALGFHSIIRVALDVDHYMREFPYHFTPRARISARFASLLRYLCKWRSLEDGRGYGAIVIVAHSQGSIITADLLRFLRKQRLRDPSLADFGPPLPREAPNDHSIPVYLLTVGSPLRQLYGLRFPHLYKWAYHSCQANWTEQKTQIPPTQEPRPDELGLSYWVNAYRSADYVGRYIWRPDQCDFLWDPGVTSMREDGLGYEVCIGAGAHTHYFDEWALEVAAYLDALVKRACEEATSALPRYPQ